MARVLIKLPNDLRDRARASGLDMSAVAEWAIAEQLRRMDTLLPPLGASDDDPSR